MSAFSSSALRPLTRILYVDHTAELGGAEVALLRLLGALDRTRFTPVVLLFSDGPLAERLRKMSVEVEILELAARIVGTSRHQVSGALFRPSALIAALGHLWRVAGLMRAGEFDLVHTTSLKADLIGGFAARLAGRPLLWHIHDRIADDYLPGKVAKVFRMLARWVPRFVVVNSEATRQTLLPFPEDRIRVVHPGVPEELLASAKINAAEVEEPVVGMVGRISPTKGQDLFIRAAALVARRFPKARFQVIGGALFQHESYELEIRQLAKALGIKVEFTGFCDDVTDRIRGLSVLVHASPTPEPFGQVVVEAMAVGTPVVATDAGGIPEIVIDGECGLLVAPGDAEVLAEKIGAMLEDRPRALMMAQRARERVAALFTSARMARKIEAVYDGMVEGEGRRSEGGGRSAEVAQPSRL